MPAALRVASSMSVTCLLRGSLGSSSPVAVPRSFSYWPTLPKLRPPKAADWPGNMLGACERAGSQVTLVMRASAMSGATAKAAVIASAAGEKACTCRIDVLSSIATELAHAVLLVPVGPAAAVVATPAALLRIEGDRPRVVGRVGRPADVWPIAARESRP